MNFQQIERFFEAGKQILKTYGADERWDCRLLHCSENVTFAVTMPETAKDGEKSEYADSANNRVEQLSGSEKYVLRVSRPGYHSLPELEAEMEWIQKISEDTSLILASPLVNEEGKRIVRVCTDGQIFYGVLRQMLSGEHPGSTGVQTEEEFEQAGEIAARLHEQVISWNGSMDLNRPVWDYESMLGSKGLFGDWRACQELIEKEQRLLEQVCCMIRKRLEHYPTDREHFGLIHADLRAANFLTEHGQMKILDFDDCGYGWFLYDLAASVSFLECEPQLGDWIRAWIRGYEKIRLFGSWEYQEIDTFVMIRRIQLLAWITSHDDSDPVRWLYEGFAEGTVKLAEKYWKNHNKSDNIRESRKT